MHLIMEVYKLLSVCIIIATGDAAMVANCPPNFQHSYFVADSNDACVYYWCLSGEPIGGTSRPCPRGVGTSTNYAGFHSPCTVFNPACPGSSQTDRNTGGTTGTIGWRGSTGNRRFRNVANRGRGATLGTRNGSTSNVRGNRRTSAWNSNTRGQDDRRQRARTRHRVTQNGRINQRGTVGSGTQARPDRGSVRSGVTPQESGGRGGFSRGLASRTRHSGRNTGYDATPDPYGSPRGVATPPTGFVTRWGQNSGNADTGVPRWQPFRPYYGHVPYGYGPPYYMAYWQMYTGPNPQGIGLPNPTAQPGHRSQGSDKGQSVYHPRIQVTWGGQPTREPFPQRWSRPRTTRPPEMEFRERGLRRQPRPGIRYPTSRQSSGASIQRYHPPEPTNRQPSVVARGTQTDTMVTTHHGQTRVRTRVQTNTQTDTRRRQNRDPIPEKTARRSPAQNGEDGRVEETETKTVVETETTRVNTHKETDIAGQSPAQNGKDVTVRETETVVETDNTRSDKHKETETAGRSAAQNGKDVAVKEAESNAETKTTDIDVHNEAAKKVTTTDSHSKADKEGTQKETGTESDKKTTEERTHAGEDKDTGQGQTGTETETVTETETHTATYQESERNETYAVGRNETSFNISDGATGVNYSESYNGTSSEGGEMIQAGSSSVSGREKRAEESGARTDSSGKDTASSAKETATSTRVVTRTRTSTITRPRRTRDTGNNPGSNAQMYVPGKFTTLVPYTRPPTTVPRELKSYYRSNKKKQETGSRRENTIKSVRPALQRRVTGEDCFRSCYVQCTHTQARVKGIFPHG